MDSPFDWTRQRWSERLLPGAAITLTGKPITVDAGIFAAGS
jgi:hypothetical protein